MITEKQATFLGRRLHWTLIELELWAKTYIQQCIDEKSLTSTEASDLIDDLWFVETQAYGWQYDPAQKSERETRIKSVHLLLKGKYNADKRLDCSVCYGKANAWTEKGAYIVCMKCQDKLTDKNA